MNKKTKEIDELITTSPFEDGQKDWLRRFILKIGIVKKLPETCECTSEQRNVMMGTFQYLGEMGTSVFYCKRCRRKRK